MFPKKRATRATKHINPLPSTGFMRSTLFFLSATLSVTKTLNVLLGIGFMRSTKRATFFFASVFANADNIHHPSISLYVVSRTIQNISFNTPYDVTMSIKSLICKITRFYMKIFVTCSYGTLKRYIYYFPVYYTKKNNPYSFPGRDFVYLLS